MNAQQLKNSILQEAIEGRLVPQDPNDEPASVLLERIREEKKRLVKEGKLKKKDLEETPIQEDEIPFEIPESWEWVRIEFAFNHSSGKQLSGADTEGTLREYITTSNLYWDRFELDNLKSMYYKDSELERCTAKKGDLLVCEGGDVGRSAIWPYDYNICLQNHVHRLRPYAEDYTRFVYYVIWYYKSIGDIGGKGIGIKGLSASALKSIIIPLPPLAEQKRIVAKIEELLPKVEEYGKAQDALDKLNAELPERLKKSILQEAISGRLVPQDPNDEPASVLLDKIRAEKAKLVKEGKLKKKDLEEIPIQEDEIPFDIPDSWEWVRVGTVGEVITGGTPSKSELKYYGNEYPFYKPADLEQGKETCKSADSLSVEGYNHSRKLPQNSVLVTCIGSIGKAGIIRKEGTCNQQINAIIPYKKLIIPEYLYYHISSSFFQECMWENSSSTTLAILNKNRFSQLAIPLPPLAEQKRIVAKIEQLLGEIDKI